MDLRRWLYLTLGHSVPGEGRQKPLTLGMRMSRNFFKGFYGCRWILPRGQVDAAQSHSKHEGERQLQINALELIYLQGISWLYITETNKVWLHQDEASSHSAKSSVVYMELMAVKTGI